MTVKIGKLTCDVRCDMCGKEVRYRIEFTCKHPTEKNQRQRAARQYGFRRIVTTVNFAHLLGGRKYDFCAACVTASLVDMKNPPSGAQIEWALRTPRINAHPIGYINQRLLT